jgi:hypothetical protein
VNEETGVAGFVYAHTRSEARSEIKKANGFKSRVPIGAEIKKVVV